MKDTPVIVLNWNGWDYTFACLRSLRNAADVTTVWLVDNGSTLDRSEEARAIWPGLRVLRLDSNYGFAGGMNRALRVAASEGYQFAYLLNNDCVVVPGFLDGAIEAARSKDVAVVGSRIAYADDRHSLIFDGEYHRRGAKPLDQMSESRPVRTTNGAGMLVRLAALERHGYFDERFFCYHEEVEMCWRLSASGLSLVIAPDSVIHHYQAGSDVDANSLYYRVRNSFLLAEHFEGWARRRKKIVALYEAVLIARQNRRGSDAEVALRAVSEAIDDGINGRYGKRLPRDRRSAALIRLRVLGALVPAAQLLLAGTSWLRRRTDRTAAPDAPDRSDLAQPSSSLGAEVRSARGE
jgi:GT2 family glycosyltransferase